jgi:hypothetical protein
MNSDRREALSSGGAFVDCHDSGRMVRGGPGNLSLHHPRTTDRALASDGRCASGPRWVQSIGLWVFSATYPTGMLAPGGR